MASGSARGGSDVSENSSDSEYDAVEERTESTDMEQEAVDRDVSSENAYRNIVDTHFIGREKISRWFKNAPTKNVRTRQHDIVIHLPGVKGEAKHAKSPKNAGSYFLTVTLLLLS